MRSSGAFELTPSYVHTTTARARLVSQTAALPMLLRMLSECERNHELGMDALLTVCSQNASQVMVRACAFWSPYALVARTKLWLGQGIAGMLWSPYALVPLVPAPPIPPIHAKKHRLHSQILT